MRSSEASGLGFAFQGFEGGRDPAQFDLLAGVPPHRPPRVVKESALTNEAGWVLDNKRTMQTTSENVFAIGDVTAVTLADDMALHKAGVFAEGQGLAVTHHISADIHKTGQKAEFDGLGFCWIESGAGSAGFASGSFYEEPNPVVPCPAPAECGTWARFSSRGIGSAKA